MKERRKACFECPSRKAEPVRSCCAVLTMRLRYTVRQGEPIYLLLLELKSALVLF